MIETTPRTLDLCAECLHWCPEGTGGRLSLDECNADVGECRKKSPVASGAAKSHAAVWPVTDWYAGCGDFTQFEGYDAAEDADDIDGPVYTCGQDCGCGQDLQVIIR